MGQKAQLWWDLPAADCFLLLKEIYRVPDAEYRETLGYLTDVLDVEKQLNIQIRRLSLGERMKMELIAVLLHRPRWSSSTSRRSASTSRRSGRSATSSCATARSTSRR